MPALFAMRSLFVNNQQGKNYQYYWERNDGSKLDHVG